MPGCFWTQAFHAWRAFSQKIERGLFITAFLRFASASNCFCAWEQEAGLMGHAAVEWVLAWHFRQSPAYLMYTREKGTRVDGGLYVILIDILLLFTRALLRVGARAPPSSPNPPASN